MAKSRRALLAYLREHLRLETDDPIVPELLQRLELPMPEEPKERAWIRWVHERRMWGVEILNAEQFIQRFGRKRVVWLVQDLPGDLLRIAVPVRPLELLEMEVA